jgi:ubiquinone biosynthesis accessory factor UbiK
MSRRGAIRALARGQLPHVVQFAGACALIAGTALIDWPHPSGDAAMTNGPTFDTRFLDELQARVAALMAGTPAADLQKNLRTVLTQQLARLDLVTREEFDTQAKVLARTRAKLEALERRVDEFEQARAAPPGDLR